jgi:chromate reductase
VKASRYIRASRTFESTWHGPDAVLLCTPEYVGALPGALKNLLEWTVEDAGTYRKPIASLNVSGPAAPTGGADAHESLRKVLDYVHADIAERACVRIPLTRDAIHPDGLIAERGAREDIATMLSGLVDELEQRESAP